MKQVLGCVPNYSGSPVRYRIPVLPVGSICHHSNELRTSAHNHSMTMADSDEDDYLSDKFLAISSTSAQTLTYAESRKQAKARSELRNAQNRTKSRRQLELESREEGLSKSLFERAQEEKETIGVENKAMAMMMKMGFKPGQSLGVDRSSSAGPSTSTDELNVPIQTPPENGSTSGHRKVPLSIDVWVGPSTCLLTTLF